MALQLHHLVSIFVTIIMISFSSCYGGNEHNNNNVDRKTINHNHFSSYKYYVREDGQATRRALSSTKSNSFSVDDFGANGNGETDDTQAFARAWKKACSTSGGILTVPSNKRYLLKPITFSGPCNSKTTMQIYGTLLASNDRSDNKDDERHWIMFEGIKNLVVEGSGSIDGNGKIWWQNSCKINKNLPCKHAPTALTFYECEDLVVSQLKIQNAQQMHVTFEKCVGVTASGLKVTSPEDSPNTDGIHITQTQNILVSNTIIGTGDDCISIENGSHMVRILDITCGPGHGISIGSLGDGKSEADVSDITVNRAKLSGTTNGVRIKTWQGGSGIARNIKFQNINLSNVANPIIIDQDYCDQSTPCKKQNSAVQIKNVVYQNIRGTSSSEPAVVFDCSESHPCQGIVMQNVKIENNGRAKNSKAACKNVQFSQISSVSPQCSST